MDETRVLIYLLGALVLVFFLAYGFRKTTHSDSQEASGVDEAPSSLHQEPSLDVTSLDSSLLSEENKGGKPSVLGFETAPSKERAINDFIAKMGREAALSQESKEGESEENLQSKMGKQTWSRMVHETFQQRVNVRETSVSPDTVYDENLIVMNIMASDGLVFSGLNIVQALNHQGFFYSEPGFFNRCDVANNLQFRVAAATGNGFLPTTELDTFETLGISFFMELNKVLEPRAAFRRMLTDAHEVNYALNGSLKDETGQPLSQQSVARYLAKIKAAEESRESVNA